MFVDWDFSNSIFNNIDDMYVKPVSPCGSVEKNLPANAGDVGSVPGSGRSSGVGNGNPFQYSCWEIPQIKEPGGLEFIGLQKSRT